MAWRYEGLYRLNKHSFKDEVVNKVSISLNSIVSNSKQDIWHYRLGHVSIDVLAHVDDIEMNCNKVFYPACPTIKLCRFPFATSSIKTTSQFQLVHMDLWGPYYVPSTT